MSIRKGKKVTIVDVAREAGTSYSTVSRVFSNSGKVAEETKQRIIEVADRLGYVPNQQARSLVGGQTQVLGVLVPRFDNGYVSSIVNGIDDEIAGTEYNLLLYTTHRAHKDEVKYVTRITNGLAEGLIVVLPRHPEAYLSALASKHFPYIFVDHEGISEDSISISATSFRGAYDATEYLIELGHRRIAFISGILELRSGLDRLHGYRAALQDYGIEVDQTLITQGDFLTESGYLATQNLLEVDPLPTAIFVSNDLMAVGAMNAYQELDGVPVGSSRELMVELLRDELGFDGVVVSDYFTLDMFIEYHHVACNKAEAAVYGLEAGIDIELPAHDIYGDPLRQALEQDDIDIHLVDTSVRRILEMKVRLGLFEQPYVDADDAVEVFMTPEQKDLSCTAAEKSIVLLKNDGLLPLSQDLESIAVIGPSADSVRLLQGNYHYPSHLEGVLAGINVSQEAPVPTATLPSMDLTDHFPPSVTVLDGIKLHIGADTTIYYEKGCDVNTLDKSGIEVAAEVAQKSKVAIVVVGGKSGLNNECTTGESIDRATLGLPGVQQQLVEAVVATGTPTVVVLINGRPLSTTWIDEHVPAVLETWLPAQEGGRAIANVLFGKTNPGGKLPVSIPRHVGQVPVYYNHKPSGGRTHWQGDYIDSPTSPLYPFGHGLSYTTFEYSEIEVSRAETSANETVNISCTVANTGDMEGDEVVQLYAHDVHASVTRPVKELKGFKRISLAPGKKVTLTFQLPVNHMAFYDRKMNFVVEPGEIEVMIGSSSADIRLQSKFEIVGPVTEVDQVFTTPVYVH